MAKEKKYGLMTHHKDGAEGYLVGDDTQPMLFATKDEAEKELKRLLKDRRYLWNVPITAEIFVNRREKDDQNIQN